MICPCPKHPIGCYGHPNACGCAKEKESRPVFKAISEFTDEELKNETARRAAIAPADCGTGGER